MSRLQDDLKCGKQALNKGILVGRARAEMWNSYRAGIYGNMEFPVDDFQDKIRKRKTRSLLFPEFYRALRNTVDVPSFRWLKLWLLVTVAHRNENQPVAWANVLLVRPKKFEKENHTSPIWSYF